MAFSDPGAKSTSLRDHADYVSLTMEFRCNLRCVHCMIEGTMDRLEPQSDASFDNVLDEQRRNRRWRGLILTGSEVTLRRDLPDLARRARAAGFARVRIQTHGARLARPDYAERLLDAGVNEFFVSVAGSDRDSHDRIVDVKGSWDRMMAGLDYLDDKPDVRLITNTVVTALSYPLLPKMVDALSHLKRLVQMEFWTYWPMAEKDDKKLCAPHAEVLPCLARAIRRAHELGRNVEVKNFPHCLLIREGLGDTLVNDQPLLLIDPAFWDEFARNGFDQCVHRTVCRSRACLGINTAYADRFGWDRDGLAPLTEDQH
ncbi:radical SAM protein [Sulfitobacter sp. D35]|uniref:radical SAM protein n=1 Tax=Sulfitobacter sp. D35 TaxID=3083252 RepID=UPI00296F6080|nr:radical SAM protein [Sulfitobacter sp. D35]MDW4496649.1 radical SAM protein [Sulfitobacter sp. D35]